MKRLQITLLTALLTIVTGAFASGWSGSGSFTRVHDWTSDAAASVPITASRMDAEDDNFSTGINACLAKNGENAATGNLNIGGYRLTSVGAGSSATDACTIGGTETLTNKTITSPSLGGTVTGTYTLGGTPTLNLATVTTSGDLPVASGGTGASSFTAYGVVTGGTTSTGALQSTTEGTTGQVLQSAGASAVPTFADRLTAATVGAVSGTTIDITDIPSWAKKITLVMSDVDTSGTSSFKVLLGDSVGLETNSYTGSYGYYGPISQDVVNTAGAFYGIRGSATASVNMMWTIVKVTGNTWIMTMTGNDSDNFILHSAGSKTLSDTLTQIRLTTINGTDTFDSGSVNAYYQ